MIDQTKLPNKLVFVEYSDYNQVAKQGSDVNDIRNSIIDTAKKMAEEDVQTNMAMGKHGSELFNDNDTIMTHCNAGALATVAYGTALGVIRATKESGKKIKVIATETRPVQQGSRLTAFELKHDNIDVSLIPDTAVGYSMAQGLVNKVIVGADRILRTGHVYNKIGTYQVATMAKQHGIPFYVAAPLSTFDLQSNPEDVVIEQRNGSEVTGIGDKKTAPDGINVINPAFDMTPQDCPLHETLIQDVTRYAKKVPGVNNVKVDIVWNPPWSMDKMSDEAKATLKNMGAGMSTPAPIDYETALPQGVGKLVKQEDGSLVLANEHDQGFMVNQAIVEFWKSCNGKRKITELVEIFAQQTGLQRNQVEKEVMQLIKQLSDGGLILIPNQPEAPNVEFKKR